MLRQPMQPSTEALKRIDLREASASNSVLKVRGAQKQATNSNTTKTMTLAATDMVWLLLDTLRFASMAKNTPSTTKQEQS
jgi:hypothetical protein